MPDRKVISTDSAPAAIGPYSQAVRTGNLLFCSGQVALDPASGELAEDDVAGQARRSLENLSAVVEAAGASLTAAVRCTVYLADMADFARVNEVYAEFFGSEDPPARVTVAAAGLPKGAQVEIDAVVAL